VRAEARAVAVSAELGWTKRCVLGTRAGGRAARAAASVLAGAGASGLARVGIPADDRSTGERIAYRLDRLGGAYLKAGQLLSTRGDLLSDDVRTALGRLCDHATPATLDDAERWLHDALGETACARLTDLDAKPIAAGSVTHVHRGRRADTGALVAIKILRPGVTDQFTADLMLMRAGARMIARLPLLRSVPVNDATRQLTGAIAAHLDLAIEARHHASLADHFAADPSIIVPALHVDLCSPTALVMDYVEGRRLDDPRLEPDVARDALARTLRALYAMLFVHGLVHCDLHPGNMLVTHAGELVLLDFGYVAQLTAEQQDAFAKLFVAMALDDAATATNVIVDTAARLPADLDRAALQAELSAHVTRTCGATAQQFNIARFVGGLFAIQHRHRIIAAPDFAMSIMALMTLEGLIQQITPDLDFQSQALPFVLRRLAS
jgi:ubiquinone biosynthesis protein